jgi:hypothetical protein
VLPSFGKLDEFWGSDWKICFLERPSTRVGNISPVFRVISFSFFQLHSVNCSLLWISLLWNMWQNILHGKPFVNIKYLIFILDESASLVHILSSMLWYSRTFSNWYMRRMTPEHNCFRNRSWLYGQIYDISHLSFQLQFQSLSLCVILEGCDFCDVKTLTFGPQWVCVPSVHLHSLTQLTAQ